MGLGPVLADQEPTRWNRRLLRALEGTAEEQRRIQEFGSDPHASVVRQQSQSRVGRCGLTTAENDSGRLHAFPEEWRGWGLEIRGFHGLLRAATRSGFPSSTVAVRRSILILILRSSAQAN